MGFGQAKTAGPAAVIVEDMCDCFSILRRWRPAIFRFREFALAGGLMSYGSSIGYFRLAFIPVAFSKVSVFLG
jgi:hypothetical protein